MKTENISVSLPGDLIELIDAACEQYDFSRSNLVKRAVKKYLAQKYSDNPEFWAEMYRKTQERSC